MTNVALAWLLAQPAVTTVVAGTQSPTDHVEHPGCELELSGDIVLALTEATDPLKAEFGTNADMRENEQNVRVR